MTIPSGDDSLTANLLTELEEMEEDSFSSALIPLVKSASVRGNLIQLSWERRNPGAREFIRMREVAPDGLIVGGWHSVDERQKNVIAWMITVFVILVIASVGLLFLALCWWGIYSALHGMM